MDKPTKKTPQKKHLRLKPVKKEHLAKVAGGGGVKVSATALTGLETTAE